MTPPRKTLIVTAPPHIFGGVASIARLMADFLAARGHAVTVAHYAALGLDPDLSVGLWGKGDPGMRRYEEWGGKEFVAVGCRLPEYEPNYYRDSPLWRELIAAHDRHVAVGGTLPVAMPFVAADVPHLVWCASDVEGDRAARRRRMGTARYLYESLAVGPGLRALERRVLEGPGRVLAISDFTAARLRAVLPAATSHIARLPIPVDLDRFRPAAEPPPAGLIGCAGRLTDPRKNLDLLIEALGLLRRADLDVRLALAGDVPPDLAVRAIRFGVADRILSRGRLGAGAYTEYLRGLDVLAIPSTQEGHNIVGVEAMACGVPVVATRCGGPDGFVRSGETGFLTGFTAAELAAAIARVVTDRAARAAMGANARRLAEAEYGIGAFAAAFDAAWAEAWPEDAPAAGKVSP